MQKEVYHGARLVNALVTCYLRRNHDKCKMSPHSSISTLAQEICCGCSPINDSLNDKNTRPDANLLTSR